MQGGGLRTESWAVSTVRGVAAEEKNPERKARRVWWNNGEDAFNQKEVVEKAWKWRCLSQSVMGFSSGCADWFWRGQQPLHSRETRRRWVRKVSYSQESCQEGLLLLFLPLLSSASLSLLSFQLLGSRHVWLQQHWNELINWTSASWEPTMYQVLSEELGIQW